MSSEPIFYIYLTPNRNNLIILAVAKQKMCKMFSQVNDSSALNKFYL